MDEPAYDKCACIHCGAGIEFPVTGSGSTIACPHCGANTTLISSKWSETGAASERTLPEDSLPSKGKRLLPIILTVLVVVGLAGAAWKFMSPERQTNKSGTPALAPAAAENSSAISPSPGPQSVDDFTVGPIALEKARGGNLVYAVGVLKNTSDQQRFGITVEIEALDRSGAKIGMATDYRPVLDPGQDWRFRALVLQPQTVKARLGRVREAQEP